MLARIQNRRVEGDTFIYIHILHIIYTIKGKIHIVDNAFIVLFFFSFSLFFFFYRSEKTKMSDPGFCVKLSLR